jgi:hypothetical protein
MTALEPNAIVWHTSSYSGGSGDCVEVAPAPEGVLVRDSKDPDGPALTVPPRPGARSSPPSPPDHRPRFVPWVGYHHDGAIHDIGRAPPGGVRRGGSRT